MSPFHGLQLGQAVGVGVMLAAGKTLVVAGVSTKDGTEHHEAWTIGEMLCLGSR